jgi:Uma2 family endonuclease
MEAGFKLGSRSWVQPDLSLITEEQDHSGDPEGYFEEAPRLAVEIISPSNTAQSVDRKLARYFEYGSEEVWVFYPASRRVWLYRRNEGVATEQRDVLDSKMFPGWKLDLAEIFA